MIKTRYSIYVPKSREEQLPIVERVITGEEVVGRVSRLPMNYFTDIKGPCNIDLQQQYPILFGMYQQKS